MRIAIARVVALPRLALLAELRVGEDDAPVDARAPVALELVAAAPNVVAVIARHRERDDRVCCVGRLRPVSRGRDALRKRVRAA